MFTYPNKHETRIMNNTLKIHKQKAREIKKNTQQKAIQIPRDTKIIPTFNRGEIYFRRHIARIPRIKRPPKLPIKTPIKSGQKRRE